MIILTSSAHSILHKCLPLFISLYVEFLISFDRFFDISGVDPGSTPKMSKNLSNDLNYSSYIEINNGKHLCSIECADDVNINIKKFIENV